MLLLSNSMADLLSTFIIAGSVRSVNNERLWLTGYGCDVIIVVKGAVVMEHGLLAKMSGVLLEYGYDLIRLTDKKDGRII